jgi:MFS family permease
VPESGNNRSVKQPPLEKTYAANVIVVLLALFPGLINTAAFGIAGPALARDLQTTPQTIAIVPLLSDAMLAFGCILAAEVARRVDGRVTFWWLMAGSIVSSAASAFAPNLAVLLAAEILHGLMSGMLFINVLPPLLLNFGSKKIGETSTVLVPALFGAATLGPIAGAMVPWRDLFGFETLMGLAAVGLALFTFGKRDPTAPQTPIDWFALIVAGLGTVVASVGFGQLAQQPFTSPLAWGPIAAGLALIVWLLIGEYRTDESLVPIKPLLSSLAIIGAITTIAGSICYTGTQAASLVTLERADGLTVTQAGKLVWPAAVAALAAGFVYGRVVTTKWVPVIGIAGLGLFAVGAIAAHLRSPLTPLDISVLSFVFALAAGLSVTPGLFLVALAFERSIVARAIALLELLRLNAGFVSQPGVEHTIGSFAGGTHAIRGIVSGAQHAGSLKPVVESSLPPAISGAFTMLLVIALVAIALSLVVFAHAHVQLRKPDLAKFDDGKAALESPEVPLFAAAGVTR